MLRYSMFKKFTTLIRDKVVNLKFNKRDKRQF